MRKGLLFVFRIISPAGRLNDCGRRRPPGGRRRPASRCGYEEGEEAGDRVPTIATGTLLSRCDSCAAAEAGKIDGVGVSTAHVNRRLRTSTYIRSRASISSILTHSFTL